MGDCHDAMTCVFGCLCPHWHHTKVDGLDGFLLSGGLPFFMAGAVDDVGVAVDASLDTAVGAAREVAFSLFFFVLVVAEGTIEGRAGGTMMTSIHSLQCCLPALFLRWRGQSCPPHSLGCPLELQTMTILRTIGQK
jgi:hypothetical protein